MRSVTYLNGSDDPVSGTRTVSFTASDGSATSLAASRTVTVTAVNDAPSVSTPAAGYHAVPGTTITLTGIGFGDLDSQGGTERATFTVDSGTLAATASSGIAVAGSGTGTVTATGTLDDLNAFMSGGHLTFTGSQATTTLGISLDDQGHSPAPARSGIASTTIVDQPPSTPSDADAGHANQIAEGAVAGTLVGITARSFDPDGDPVSYALTANPGGFFAIDPATGVVTVSAAGATGIDYESALGHAYTITVAAADGGGAGGLSSTQDFVIAVTDVPPTATGFAATSAFAVQGGAAIPLLTATPTVGDVNSTGLSGASVAISAGYQPGDVLSATTTGTGISASYANGTLTLSGTDTFAHYGQVLASVTYQDGGTDASSGAHPGRAIVWSVSDGTESSVPVTTAVSIDRPVSTTADTIRAVALTNGPSVQVNVLANDFDLDGDSLAVTSIQPPGGSAAAVPTGTAAITVSGTYGDLLVHQYGSATYMPGATAAEQSNLAGQPNGHATDVFTYTVGDGHGGETSATLAVTLDHPPTTASRTVIVLAGASVSGTGGTTGTGALAGDSDSDGDALGITSAEGPSTASVLVGTTPVTLAGSYGTLSLATDGSYSYAADATNAVAGAHAVDSFTMTVASDGGPATAIETLSFTVDRAPVLSLSPVVVSYTAGSPGVLLQTAATISDPDGTDLIASAALSVTAGAFADDGDRFLYNGKALSSAPTAVTLGSDQFTLTSTGETVAISGSGSQAEYQTLLDGLAFASSAADPTNAGANGSRTVAITVTDAFGATSAPQSVTVVIPPLAPRVALAHDTGSSASDRITSDGTLAVIPAEAGGTIEYATDATTFSSTAPTYASDGSQDGSKTVYVRQTDAAGNHGAIASLTFLLDTTAPAVPSAPTLTSDTGSSATDRVTSNPAIAYAAPASGDVLLYSRDGGAFTTAAPAFAIDGSADGAHTVAVEEQDAAGNVSGPATLSFTLDTRAPATPSAPTLTSDTGSSATDRVTNNPSITYAAPASGDVLLYSRDGGAFTTAAPVFATDGSADGAHTVAVEEQDAAGNISGASSLAFTLDSAAPVAPGLFLTNDTGSSNTDRLTRDASLTVTPAEPGGRLTYIVDGSAVAGYSADGLAQGAHTVAVMQTDAAGNVSDAASLAFMLDSVAPAATLAPTDPTATSAASVHYGLTLSEAVSGLDASDFRIDTTGTLRRRRGHRRDPDRRNALQRDRRDRLRQRHARADAGRGQLRHCGCGRQPARRRRRRGSLRGDPQPGAARRGRCPVGRPAHDLHRQRADERHRLGR